MNEVKLPKLNEEDVHEDETRDHPSSPDLVAEAGAEDVTEYAVDESEEQTKLQAPDSKLLASMKPPIPREE